MSSHQNQCFYHCHFFVMQTKFFFSTFNSQSFTEVSYWTFLHMRMRLGSTGVSTVGRINTYWKDDINTRYAMASEAVIGDAWCVVRWRAVTVSQFSRDLFTCQFFLFCQPLTHHARTLSLSFSLSSSGYDSLYCFFYILLYSSTSNIF